MSNSTVIHPDYIRIVERKTGGWLIKTGRLFYKTRKIAVDFQDFELLYGISKQQLIIELFRINGGLLGYYVADLRHKKYYYCGKALEDVKAKLLSLGIGRVDP
jgi:hypothetical protein